MPGVILLSQSPHPGESMHGHARTFSEQVIASIIDNSRCGISDVAFHTAPPIGGLSCLLCNTFDIFAPWPRKWSSNWPNVVYTLHKWLISIFLQTIEASNPQLYTDICLEGFCILCVFTANEIVSYFRSAANRIHATATVAEFVVTKQSFWKISETANASNFTQRFVLHRQLVGFLVYCLMH